MWIRESVCIVTGGAAGLGRGTVEHFVEAGARVAALDVAPIPEALVERGVLGIQADVTDEGAVRGALDQVVERFGAVHVAVNCAGVVKSRPTLAADGIFPIELFRRTIDINLTGTFIVLACAAERMALNPAGEDGERGVIVNTSSIAGYDGSSSAAYAASKGGVVQLSLTTARDLAPFGIRVNSIAPGYMATDMFAGLAPEYVERLTEEIVYPKRLGRPADFARLAQHIVENPYLNGTNIRFDGGARN